jgi:hypothetical protein
MRTLTLSLAAIAVTMVAALHAEEPPIPFSESTVSGVRDATALIASSPSDYDPSSCWRLLRKLIHARDRSATLRVYAVCPQDDPAQDYIRALERLAWPNPPGRH